jgi:DNA-binding MarR family transcriptional regulator
MTSSPWLSEPQQRAWRGWLAVTACLPAALNQQLQRDSALSLQDFDVLVQLTEAPEHRARVSDLARTMQWERSRLSHHVKRMEARGLVVREECVDDGRGAYVVLTPRGLADIERAAPEHARTVKELVFGTLTEAELSSFTSAAEKILANLSARAELP